MVETLLPTCVMSFSLTLPMVICVWRCGKGACPGCEQTWSGCDKIEVQYRRRRQARRDGFPKTRKTQKTAREGSGSELRVVGGVFCGAGVHGTSTANRASKNTRTYRSNLISMNRAFRLLCVHIRSTVESAWFNDPLSAVT